MTKETIEIELPVSKDEFIELAKAEPVRAANALAMEIQRFDDWMEKTTAGGLSRVESRIIKEYLGFKLIQ